MKLQVIGSSPAWPNPGGAHTGLLVSGAGSLLLDCGPGVLARLRERYSENGWPRVDAIAITHFHLDHWGDLVPWVWGNSFGLGHEMAQPELHVPPGGRERLRRFGTDLGRDDMFETAFQVSEYAERTPFAAAGFQVTPLRVPHYRLDTYSFRVDDGGHVLCYSGDAAPCDALVDAARDADLFVCEATLARGDLDGTPRGHLAADEAIDVYRRSGARRLLLTHRPAEFPQPDGVEVAYDGFEVDL